MLKSIILILLIQSVKNIYGLNDENQSKSSKNDFSLTKTNLLLNKLTNVGDENEKRFNNNNNEAASRQRRGYEHLIEKRRWGGQSKEDEKRTEISYDNNYIDECKNIINQRRRSEITGVLSMLSTILKSKEWNEEANELIERINQSLRNGKTSYDGNDY